MRYLPPGLPCGCGGGCVKTEVGSRKSEVGSRESEVGSRKSEDGSRKMEVGPESSDKEIGMVIKNKLGNQAS